MSDEESPFGVFLSAFAGEFDDGDLKEMPERTAAAANWYTGQLLGREKRWDEYLMSLNGGDCDSEIARVEEYRDKAKARFIGLQESGDIDSMTMVRIVLGFNFLFETTRVIGGKHPIDADLGQALDAIITAVSVAQEIIWAEDV